MNSSNYLSIVTSRLVYLFTIIVSPSLFISEAITVPPPPSEPQLENPWQLVQWERKNKPQSPLKDTDITVEFKEGTVSGSGGCNNYNGSYQTIEEKLAVGELAATRKACPPRIERQEIQYLTALQGAQRFEITESGELRITYQTDRASGILVFQPTNQPASGGSWLDKTEANWNQPGQSVPRAPIQAGDNLSSCTTSFRTATLPEDKSVQIGGWMLSGSAQIFGSTTIISGMANADGQCRPLQFQYFVFKNGNFVGTLSPTVMDSRTDGSIFEVELFNENEMRAKFNRYKDSDALCCASGESYLFYKITETSKGLVIEPQLPASTNTIEK